MSYTLSFCTCFLLEDDRTLPVDSQLSAPLSERLRLAVHLVLFAGPEIVTVSASELLPQMKGSEFAAQQPASYRR